MIISFTEENYLKIIYHLSSSNLLTVSTNSLAEAMSTSAASVTDMLKKLSEKGLINYIKYQGVTLTSLGEEKALIIIRKHRLWEVFLVDKLKFKWDEVHDMAEELEHINSSRLINRLEEFLNFPKTDPHGDPIPDKEGKIISPNLIPLSKLKEGENGIISGVREHSPSFLQHLENNDLVLGKKILVKERIAFDDSLIIEITNKQLTVTKEVAKNLLLAL